MIQDPDFETQSRRRVLNEESRSVGWSSVAWAIFIAMYVTTATLSEMTLVALLNYLMDQA